jgi:pimeloyl-ACP methyl ester carboxylesterase
MTGLRPPPKREKPGGVVLRFVVLIILVIVVGIIIFSAVTQQRLELIEDTTIDSLQLESVVEVDGVELNVVREGEGQTPLVMLHDVDIAGQVIWDGVASGLGSDFDIMRVDLPGFGFSQRFPEEGPPHTVSAMAAIVADLIAQTWVTPVNLAGVGLGGEVAAEVAVTHPEAVASLLMIDVDFYRPDGWVEFLERIPWVGRAATFTFDTGGSRSFERWAPNCESGGWCPTQSQAEQRDLATTIVNSTDSFRSFRRTPAASLVPSSLNEITVPVHYLWSQAGGVPRESVDKVQQAIPQLQVDVFADAWKVHLDDPASVAGAIQSMLP